MALKRTPGVPAEQVFSLAATLFLPDGSEVANQQQFFAAPDVVQGQALQILMNAVARVDAEPATRDLDRANTPNHFYAGTAFTAPQKDIQLQTAVRFRDKVHSAQGSSVGRIVTIEPANRNLNGAIPVGSKEGSGGDVELSGCGFGHRILSPGGSGITYTGAPSVPETGFDTRFRASVKEFNFVIGPSDQAIAPRCALETECVRRAFWW